MDPFRTKPPSTAWLAAEALFGQQDPPSPTSERTGTPKPPSHAAGPVESQVTTAAPPVIAVPTKTPRVFRVAARASVDEPSLSVTASPPPADHADVPGALDGVPAAPHKRHRRRRDATHAPSHVVITRPETLAMPEPAPPIAMGEPVVKLKPNTLPFGYPRLVSKIELLRDEAERLRAQELPEVLARIHGLIARHGITLDELGG